MRHVRHPAAELGADEPLYSKAVHGGPPDRRRVSLRWLAGSVLTGIFSAFLVGGALQAAIGRNAPDVLRPSLALARAVPAEASGTAVKGDRIRPVVERQLLRRVIPVSTVTRQGDRNLVKVRPFAHVAASLAAPVATEIAAQVPDFNPLTIFSDGDEPVEMAASDALYGANVEGEVSIKVSDFPTGSVMFDETAELPAEEVAQAVRDAAPFLADGAVEVASLPYIDPGRFEYASTDPAAALSSLAAAVPENVSLVEKSEDGADGPAIEEKIIGVTSGDTLTRLLEEAGATRDEAVAAQSALLANFSFDFRGGQKLRLGLAADEAGRVRPVRVSLYGEDSHLASVALADTGAFVAAEEPAFDDSLFAEAAPEPAAGALPSLYAGLWRTGLSLGMPEPLIENLVRIFSFDLDLQGRLAPADTLEVVYAADEEAGEAAEILYAAVTLGGVPRRFYRFRTADDGSVDYYDEDGKSAKKFLMRKPMAGGRFTSSFGMRKHPILGRYKLHSGVDWAAPTGTPIFAAGNGTVEYAGWKAGYGKHVRLRHANGYESAYSHMSGIGKGVKPGGRVRQGQIIGYVGSTGLSTGAHLHYEVLVNDRFVDPMKIRLPRGRELQGPLLAEFQNERLRIDSLLAREAGSRLAAAD